MLPVVDYRPQTPVQRIRRGPPPAPGEPTAVITAGTPVTLAAAGAPAASILHSTLKRNILHKVQGK